MDEFPRELQHGSGVPMVLEPTRLLVVLSKKIDLRELQDRLKKADFVLEEARKTRPVSKAQHSRAISVQEPEKASRPRDTLINHTETRFWIRSASEKPVDDQLIQGLLEVFDGLLDWVGPVYRIGTIKGLGGMLCPLPNVLVIRPADQAQKQDKNHLAEILQEFGLKEVPEKSNYLGDYRYFTLPDYFVFADSRKNNAYNLRDVLKKELSQFISDARLENMPMLSDDTGLPNDSQFAAQWNMIQIKAGGPGITGWDITQGNEEVIIAVIDKGCDLNHPDIHYAGVGVNLGDMSSPGSPTGTSNKAHGTACAGIVAATINNSLGVAGVAGRCKIMPLARQNQEESEVVLGIHFATDHGAKVINMSFARYRPHEGGAPTGWDFHTIDLAIEYAIARGVVVCAATGNADLNVIGYPARHPLVMACGATNREDTRVRMHSRTNDHINISSGHWGSNYGIISYNGQTTGVSVMAPGIDIPTTDITDTDGFNMASGMAGDYALDFWGTSAATPHVAGLAALLFSKFSPRITGADVRRIIEQTADKVSVPYSNNVNFPHGKYHNKMGYGRINVLTALQKAALEFPDP
jgi:subtilisin family serine protease